MSDRAHTPAAAQSDGSIQFGAVLILLLTALVAVVWSHYKMLSQDEIFVLQTDSVSSLRELIHIQRSYPISLDPLLFHLLAHACTKLFGVTALTLRLPSIFGFLLMQLCLFLATRRIAGARAALVATAFPALTATLFYAPEARPYGLLLGLSALTFVAWQSATRNTPIPQSTDPEHRDIACHPERSAAGAKSKDPRILGMPPRTRALILLALSIALTLNTHYFGVLILIPIFFAELARTEQRRRLDLPVLGAILLGMAGIVFTLPFQHAAGEFRKHYYNAGAISVRAVSQGYRSLFVNYTTQSLTAQRVQDVLLILFVIAVAVLCTHRLRRGSVTLNAPALIFLLALAALPLFGVLLAIFVTHSIEVRYVLSAIIAIAIFTAIATEPWLDRLSPSTVTALLLFGILLGGVLRIRHEKERAARQFAELTLPAAIKAQLLSLPDTHLYIQDMGHFEVASYYEPDPAVRSRLALLYSREDELLYDFHDTASLTAEHMRHFTDFNIVPYAQLKSTPGDHMLVLYHSGWDWTDEALAADRAHITTLGPALGGDAVTARFHP
jgi:hypothetical protein